MQKNNTIVNYLLLLGIGIIWGSQFIFNNIAVSTLPPIAVATGRVLFGALTLACLSFIFQKKNAAAQAIKLSFSIKLRLVLLAFFECVIPFFCIVWGQQYVSSSVTAILIGTIPLFTVLLVSLFVSSEIMTKKTFVSIFIGFVGLLILIYPTLSLSQFTHLRAEFFILCGAFSFAIALVLIRTMPPLPPTYLMKWTLAIATIPMIICLAIVDPHILSQINFKSFLAILVLGVFCSGAVLLMYATLISRAGATFTSLCNFLVPLFGTILGASLLGDKLHPNMIIALLVIILSLFVNNWSGKKASPVIYEAAENG